MLAARFLVERIRDRCEPRARAGASSGSLHRRLMPGISLIDLKLGLRMLLKYPGLTLVSTAALAIAIAIIAGFHTATAFMVRPTLPVPDGNRVVAVWQHDMTTGDPGMQTVGDMVAWRDGLETLDGVGAFRLRERGLAVNGAMRLVRAAEITPSVFEMIRITPQLGRPLVAGDAQPGSPPVALIGFDLWQSALDAARSLFPRLYPRTIEVIQQIGASGLVAMPTEKDLKGPLSEDIKQYFQAARAEAFDHIPLSRLAWDTTLSAFAPRQVLYERFFFGDPVRMAGALVTGHGAHIHELADRVREFVGASRDEAFSDAS